MLLRMSERGYGSIQKKERDRKIILLLCDCLYYVLLNGAVD